MNTWDKLKTRIIIASSINIPPDDIDIMDANFGSVLFFINDFQGISFVLGFSYVPSVKEAKKQIEDLYMSTFDFDEEYGD